MNATSVVAVTETTWYSYVRRITNDEAPSRVADRAGFDKSAMTRWKNGAGADAAFVVKLAREYGRPVTEALVAAGLITAEEAALREVPVGADEAIRTATDDVLLAELRSRLANVGGAADDDFSYDPQGPRKSGVALASKTGVKKINK